MVYGYIRVSTDKQTVENQRFEIERFCKKEGLTIDGWIEETISGTKNYSKRALGKLYRVISSWTQPLYDYGNTQYLYDKRESRLDD